MRVDSRDEKFNVPDSQASNLRCTDLMRFALEEYVSSADSVDNGILCGVGTLLNTKAEIGDRGVRIPEYKDFSDEIEGLYVGETQIDEMNELYHRLLNSRKSLSASRFFDFTTSDSAFSSYAEKYLDDVKAFFRKLFSERIVNSPAVLPLGILRQIVEGDMRPVPKSDIYYAEKTKTIRIGLANPLVLSSLYLTRLQFEDFYRFCADLNIGRDNPCWTMYAELLGNKVERLFRDSVIMYGGEFYRIIDYDADGYQFVARNENDLSSIEKINAIRLYEKIVKSADRENFAERIKCLVIGEVRRGSKELLGKMLEASGMHNVSVDYMESRQRVHDVLTHRDVFLGLISMYKKVFVLDCPEVYSDISMNEMSDDVDILNRCAGSYSELLSVTGESETRDFYNKNGFAAIYYRVQNYLVRPDLRNSSKARYVNRSFLNCIDDYFKCDENGKTIRPELSGKEVYVYLSNNRDFKDELYDSYNFVRVERYNSKDCRIVKFSDRTPVPFISRERTVKTSFYKILKMLSNSGQFFCSMTGDLNENPDVGSVCKAIRMAQDTKISINYNPIGDNNIPSRIKVAIDVECSEECKTDAVRYDRYREIVGKIVTESFDSHRKAGCRIENRVLIQCFQKAIACVVSGCARNFNDLLFHHFYETWCKPKNGRFVFDAEAPEFVETSSNGGWADEETTSYSYKRTAYALMSDLDSAWYRKSDIVSHMRRTALNNEKIDYYVENIKDACINLGYTYSALYSRLVRLYS